jgi:hypothetical protein
VEKTLDEIDTIVGRATKNDIPVHIVIVSGFFHSQNPLRETAIRDDVRNAQWFADGSIAPPGDTQDRGRIPRAAWITPSRHAVPLRMQIEEGIRRIGARIASLMEKYPDTLLSISGDGEVELSYERSKEGLLADYSPFAIAEFRDWLRDTSYNGDLSPGSDENRDGRTFNKDFGEAFVSWRLRYFENSGPLSYRQYQSLQDKLPRSGPFYLEGGFDAPRNERASRRYRDAWQRFRVRMVANYTRDFAGWLSADGRIPPARLFSHQIPAEYLFERQADERLRSSASPLQTAFIQPFGSPGVTAYNTYDGRRHVKTAGGDLFEALARSGPHWGILEYNPSVPAVNDESYYLAELRSLYRFRPRVLVPFAWLMPEIHRLYEIKGTALERALRKFVAEIKR